jgi:hypothetical protein
MTPSQQKKAHRDAIYKLNLDMTKTVKDGLKNATDDELQSLIAGFMQLMTPAEGVEEVTLPVDAIQQMAVFASQCISRQLLERQKA